MNILNITRGQSAGQSAIEEEKNAKKNKRCVVDDNGARYKKWMGLGGDENEEEVDDEAGNNIMMHSFYHLVRGLNFNILSQGKGRERGHKSMKMMTRWMTDWYGWETD